MKVCFAASSGGHLEEIMCLRELTQKCDSFLVTEAGECSNVSFADRQYMVNQINRKEKGFLIHFLKLIVRAFKIMRKEKPDVVISTGALATVPFCLWGKLFGKKIVYIESFARIDSPSLTGKIMRPFADLFIVQWEEMLKFFPNAVYTGGIF